MSPTDITQFHAFRVVVKNTFLDGFEEDISDSTIDRRRRLSAPTLSLPVALSSRTSCAHPPKRDSKAAIEGCSYVGTDNTSLSDGSSGLDSTSLCDISELFRSASSDAGTGSCSLGATSEASWSNEDANLERFPQESVGSRDHDQGGCRPCVWFWRPASCSKGSSCEYCHLCDSGAVERAVAMKKKAKHGARTVARYKQPHSRK